MNILSTILDSAIENETMTTNLDWNSPDIQHYTHIIDEYISSLTRGLTIHGELTRDTPLERFHDSLVLRFEKHYPKEIRKRGEEAMKATMKRGERREEPSRLLQETFGRGHDRNQVVDVSSRSIDVDNDEVPPLRTAPAIMGGNGTGIGLGINGDGSNSGNGNSNDGHARMLSTSTDYLARVQSGVSARSTRSTRESTRRGSVEESVDRSSSPGPRASLLMGNSMQVSQGLKRFGSLLSRTKARSPINAKKHESKLS